jgi:cation diffusion facilitator CzcD-associated flavoprotein CzcO
MSLPSLPFLSCSPFLHTQGSSSIQIVPALQSHAAHVDNYVRGSAWIATPFASTELTKRNPDANNYTFTEEEKKRFREDPEGYLEFRKNMEREVRYFLRSFISFCPCERRN